MPADSTTDFFFFLLTLFVHIFSYCSGSGCSKPGLKVNQSIFVSCIKMFFTACVLYSLRLFKLETEGQTIQSENLNEKLQN